MNRVIGKLGNVSAIVKRTKSISVVPLEASIFSADRMTAEKESANVFGIKLGENDFISQDLIIGKSIVSHLAHHQELQQLRLGQEAIQFTPMGRRLKNMKLMQ